MYDTVAQYDQVLSGEVEDWHPPVMVRLWELLHGVAPGAAPMFVLQVGLYALGFGLIVATLVRIGRPYASAGAALLALSPLTLGWQMVVLKDGQMLGALVAAFAIVTHYRLRNVPIPTPFAVVVAVLLGYSTLVRANAVFATIPLLAVFLKRPRPILARASLAIVMIVVVLALEPVINDRIFGASPSRVAKSQPLFDLAAIAVAEPQPVLPFTSVERNALKARHCVSAFFWDPVGDPTACGTMTERANALSERELYIDLAHAAALHPLAYVGHRLRHWNSTERWLVPPGLIGAAPPLQGEPNNEGLVSPKGPLFVDGQQFSAWEATTPLGWPIFWTALAVLLLPTGWRYRADAEGGLALALIVSALALEASFLVISIASDLRYHLWSMIAAPLALIFLGRHLRSSPRAWFMAGAFLMIVVAGGILSRAMLPKAPSSYQAMLHAPAI
ncbi:MAG TPA: hypothetical protein VGU01_08855 [Sphingomicrobium sp.]|nr:hypothetical protein [Sphingomicrobium sp.]